MFGRLMDGIDRTFDSINAFLFLRLSESDSKMQGFYRLFIVCLKNSEPAEMWRNIIGLGFCCLIFSVQETLDSNPYGMECYSSFQSQQLQKLK